MDSDKPLQPSHLEHRSDARVLHCKIDKQPATWHPTPINDDHATHGCVILSIGRSSYHGLPFVSAERGKIKRRTLREALAAPQSADLKGTRRGCPKDPSNRSLNIASILSRLYS